MNVIRGFFVFLNYAALDTITLLKVGLFAHSRYDSLGLLRGRQKGSWDPLPLSPVSHATWMRAGYLSSQCHVCSKRLPSLISDWIPMFFISSALGWRLSPVNARHRLMKVRGLLHWKEMRVPSWIVHLNHSDGAAMIRAADGSVFIRDKRRQIALKVEQLSGNKKKSLLKLTWSYALEKTLLEFRLLLKIINGRSPLRVLTGYFKSSRILENNIILLVTEQQLVWIPCWIAVCVRMLLKEHLTSPPPDNSI